MHYKIFAIYKLNWLSLSECLNLNCAHVNSISEWLFKIGWEMNPFSSHKILNNHFNIRKITVIRLDAAFNQKRFDDKETKMRWNCSSCRDANNNFSFVRLPFILFALFTFTFTIYDWISFFLTHGFSSIRNLHANLTLVSCLRHHMLRIIFHLSFLSTEFIERDKLNKNRNKRLCFFVVCVFNSVCF